MDFDQCLEVVNSAVFAEFSRHLNDVETAVLMGAWHGQTYEQIADQSGYSISYLTRDIGPKLWKLLSAALGETVSKTSFQAVLEKRWRAAQQIEQTTAVPITPVLQTVPVSQESPVAAAVLESQLHRVISPQSMNLLPSVPQFSQIRSDWGESTDVSFFYGRSEELNTLQHWLLHDRCRLVTLLGMGGIGKTALAVKLAQQVQNQFEFLIWRSLRNAPALKTLLQDLVSFVSDQQESEGSLSRLTHWLRQHRCLIVLDNAETILRPGEHVGRYRTEYEDYAHFFRVLGETFHQSCLVLTSREKPGDIVALEGSDTPVRSLQVTGSPEAAYALIQAKGLFGSASQQQELCQHYGYNPLALKIIATSIQDIFDGEISQFLAQDTVIFNSIRRLLDQQFERLSLIEKTVMYWLAINREWTTISELATDILLPISRAGLLEALESLSWRSLIEKRLGSYTQQPVVMEYITDTLVELITTELTTANLSLFISLALMKTTAKDYVRESQSRLILEAIAAQLQPHFSSGKALEHHIHHLLKQLQTEFAQTSGYAGGNLINLSRYLNFDWTGADFSHLNVWHAYLQGMTLRRVNFQNADLAHSVFTQTFSNIFSVAVSADSQWVATGDDSGEIYLWQLSRLMGNAQPQITFKGHSGWIWAVAFSPDGQTLASCSVDQTVRLWDVQTGRCLHVLSGHRNWVISVSFSPDGQTLASGSSDRVILLWNVATGQRLSALEGHHHCALAVAFSPDGKTLVSGSADNTVKLWDLDTGQCLKTLSGHQNWVWAVAFSPDGRWIASGGADRTLRLWDGKTGDLRHVAKGHTGWVKSISFATPTQPYPPPLNGSDYLLATGSYDQTVRFWDVNTGQTIKVLRGHGDRVQSAVLTPNGQTLITCSADHTLKLWDVATGQVLKTLAGYTDWIQSVAFSPVRGASSAENGPTLASGSYGRAVRLWDLPSKRYKSLLGHTKWVFSVAFSPDGQQVASASADQTVKLWDVATGQCLRTLQGHTNWVWSVAFSPVGGASGEDYGQLLATASEDQTVKLWDVATGQCLRTFTDHTNWVFSVAFSPDGRWLASGSYDLTARLWDVRSGELLRVLEGHKGAVRSVAFSPDGQTLATASEDSTIRLWNLVDGKGLMVLSGHTNALRSVAFSPDGRLLASGAYDHTVKIWDVATGSVLNTLQGHENAVQTVAFNPHPAALWRDSDWVLASAGNDETIRIWQANSADCWTQLVADKPYEDMNVTGVTGITEAQKAALILLGAIATEL